MFDIAHTYLFRFTDLGLSNEYITKVKLSICRECNISYAWLAKVYQDKLFKISDAGHLIGTILHIRRKRYKVCKKYVQNYMPNDITNIIMGYYKAKRKYAHLYVFKISSDGVLLAVKNLYEKITNVKIE
jgi:hypothetical protein